MSRTLCIARREYLASVKTKGFIIGLFLAPLLMCGGLIAMVLLRGQVDVHDKRVAVLDRSGLVSNVLVQAARKRNAAEVRNPASGVKVKPAYLIEVVQPEPDQLPAQRLALSERIRRGELHAFVEIRPGVLHPGTNPANARITYHAQGAALDPVRRWLEGPVNNELRRLRLAEAGVDESKMNELFAWTSVQPMGLVSTDALTGAVQKARRSNELAVIGIPVLSMILMWVMVMMGASPLLNAVMEEKNQRIAEVLLGYATPFELMLGKLLGGLAVALTGAAFYLGAGAFALLQLGMFDFYPLRLLPWFVIYVVFGILMTGSFATALGSLCNDAKDAQNLMLPTLLPMLVPMFLLGPLLQQPHSAFATWVSLFPPFTPMLMLLRQSSPTGVPFWQPWVGLVGMLVYSLLLVAAAARVFRIGLLMQGKPPRLRDLCRWALRG